MDQEAHRPNRPSVFEEQIFYRQMLNIYNIQLPSAPLIQHSQPERFLLTRIQPCPISRGPTPNTSSFLTQAHKNATIEVIDIITISAVIGRFEYGGRTYIIDCSDGGSKQSHHNGPGTAGS